jgi:hypothetical protein
MCLLKQACNKAVKFILMLFSFPSLISRTNLSSNCTAIYISASLLPPSSNNLLPQNKPTFDATFLFQFNLQLSGHPSDRLVTAHINFFLINLQQQYTAPKSLTGSTKFLTVYSSTLTKSRAN